MGDLNTPSSCLFVSDLPSDITEKVSQGISQARAVKTKQARSCLPRACVGLGSLFGAWGVGWLDPGDAAAGAYAAR